MALYHFRLCFPCVQLLLFWFKIWCIALALSISLTVIHVSQIKCSIQYPNQLEGITNIPSLVGVTRDLWNVYNKKHIMLFSWFLNEPSGYLLAQTPVFMRFIFFAEIVYIAHWGKNLWHRGPRQASEQSNYPRKWLYMKCLGYCLQISAITNVSVWQASGFCLNPQ